MNHKTKNDIRSKARLIYGLTHVLKDDIDSLRTDAKTCELNRLIESLNNTNETIEKIIDIIAEIEYSIYLDNSQNLQGLL